MTFEQARTTYFSKTSALPLDIDISEELASLDIIISEWFESSEHNPYEEQELREVIFKYSMDKKVNDL